MESAALVAEMNRGRPSKLRRSVLAYADGVTIGKYESITEAAKSLGLSAGKVSECVNGKRKSTKGYTFKGEEQ